MFPSSEKATAGQRKKRKAKVGEKVVNGNRIFDLHSRRARCPAGGSLA